MGHVGLLPQSILETGGYKIQGRTAESAAKTGARWPGVAGCRRVCRGHRMRDGDVAAQISTGLEIPTIGIGAGADCDGQILVSNDMLGQFTWFTPKFVKRYANLAEQMRLAFEAYKKEVESGEFPAATKRWLISTARPCCRPRRARRG